MMQFLITCIHSFFPDKLKRIDLRGNQISGMDEDVFLPLPQLEDLLLADNNLHILPALPATMRLIEFRSNLLTSAGVQQEAFKVYAGVAGRFCPAQTKSTHSC